MQNLAKILSSRYGKEVRQAIHDSIHDCYEDGKAGATDMVAREQIANLVSENNPTEGNSELIDTRVGYDGTTYPSAGEAIRKQIGSLSEEIYKVKNELKHLNILDIEDSISGYSYRSQIGSGIEKIENPNYTACNQIFSVVKDEKYTHNWLYAALYVYDNNKKLILYDYADSIPHTLTIPENASYMTIAGSTIQNSDIMLVSGDVLPSSYIPYDLLGIKTIQGNDLEKRTSELEKSVRLNGVKWCAFGDSLTSKSTLSSQLTGEKNYVDYVSESLGLDVTNCGVGGTGYMKTENRFVNRVNNIPEDTEILTVFGSFNDFEYIESSLGEIEDAGTNTIYGCMKSFYDAVFERCPNVVAGIILPTKWGYLSPQEDPNAAQKCDMYISALVNVAKYYAIPVLDLYNFSNLRPWNTDFANEYYMDDNGDGTINTVHPLDPAHKKFIAPKVENFIKSILSSYRFVY